MRFFSKLVKLFLFLIAISSMVIVGVAFYQDKDIKAIVDEALSSIQVEKQLQGSSDALRDAVNEKLD